MAHWRKLHSICCTKPAFKSGFSATDRDQKQIQSLSLHTAAAAGGCVTSAGHAPSCDRGCPMRRLVYRRADIWSIWLPGEPDWRDEAPVCGWTVTSKHVSEGHVWEATLTRPKIASVGGRRTRSIRQEPEMSAGRFAFQ